MTVTTPTAGPPAIRARRISFDRRLAELPQHFTADADLVSSHLVAVLSAVFPAGEDFFVRSVRARRDELTDPELAASVAGFIGQEAVHGREHRALNERLAELGYPVGLVDRATDRGLRFRERVLSADANLAATAALEHWTATLAELLMTDPDARTALGDGVVRDLLLWHALEESEHKAVAFDVYRAVGGSERLRTITMSLVSFGFVASTALFTAWSVWRDPASREPGRLRESLRRLRASPFASRSVIDRLRDYNRPDFHPSDNDNAALVDRWRDELFGDAGRLRALVA